MLMLVSACFLLAADAVPSVAADNLWSSFVGCAAAALSVVGLSKSISTSLLRSGNWSKVQDLI